MQWTCDFQIVLGDCTASSAAETSITLKNFEEQGKLALEECIAKGEDLVSSDPRSHPFCPILLMLACRKHHIYSNAEIPLPSSYLDDIIMQLGEAIFLASGNDDEDGGGGIIIAEATSLFAFTLFCRFDRTRQPSDLENGIACLRCLLRLPLEGTTIQFSGVMERLAQALWSKTASDPAGEQENIEEMLTQYHSCLPWDPSNERPEYIANTLDISSHAVLIRIDRTGEMEYLEQLLKPLCGARKICQP